MSDFKTVRYHGVMCGGKTFTPDLTWRIRNLYTCGRTDIYVSTILVNKNTGKVYVEMRVGTPKHNIFWDMCEVEDFVPLRMRGVKIDKFGPEYECVMFRGKTSDVYLQDGKKAFDVNLNV